MKTKDESYPDGLTINYEPLFHSRLYLGFGIVIIILTIILYIINPNWILFMMASLGIFVFYLSYYNYKLHLEIKEEYYRNFPIDKKLIDIIDKI